MPKLVKIALVMDNYGHTGVEIVDAGETQADTWENQVQAFRSARTHARNDYVSKTCKDPRRDPDRREGFHVLEAHIEPPGKQIHQVSAQELSAEAVAEILADDEISTI